MLKGLGLVTTCLYGRVCLCMFSVFVAESWVGSGGDFRYYTSERDPTHRPVEAVGMRV